MLSHDANSSDLRNKHFPKNFRKLSRRLLKVNTQESGIWNADECNNSGGSRAVADKSITSWRNWRRGMRVMVIT